MTDDEKRATAKYYILYKCGFINIYTTTLAQKG